MSLVRALILFLALSVPALGCEGPAGLATLRSGLLTLTNTQRSAAGLVPLVADARLEAVAQAQACHMAGRERLTHRGRWFAGLGRRLRREGYAYALAVENIGEGGRRLRREGYAYALAVENIGEGHETAAAIIAGWMESPSHRENMLADGLRAVGYGVARAANGRLHWSMVAAAER